jgi:hypothetical protein
MKAYVAVAHESASGTKRTSRSRPEMSAFGGKPDMEQTSPWLFLDGIQRVQESQQGGSND